MAKAVSLYLISKDTNFYIDLYKLSSLFLTEKNTHKNLK